MPKIILKDGSSFEVDKNKRLILALVDNDVDILHRCGGFAKCTTCRVDFFESEPDAMTEAEKTRLEKSNLIGEARLSCQILCDHDMKVQPFLSLESTGLDDRGKRPEDNITPDPIWTESPQKIHHEHESEE